MGKPKIRKIEIDTDKVTMQALRKAGQPIYLSLNFSFLTENSDYNMNNHKFSIQHRAKLIDRIIELSKDNFVSLTARTDKKIGLEKLSNLSGKDKLSKIAIPQKFVNSERNQLANGDFWTFRLCPNNNPYASRIIGKMIDNVLYVMFIDIDHILYSKRK